MKATLPPIQEGGQQYRGHDRSSNKWFFSSVGGFLSGIVCWGLLSHHLHKHRPSGGTFHVKCLEKRSKQYNFLAEAVEIASPAVVYIEKTQKVATIFGEQMAVNSGSGFVVDANGYVLTNAHVVGTARQVSVKLASGRVLTGEVTDIDQVADLALVKVQVPSGEKLAMLKFGSSSDVRPGEWVVALGSPLSLSNTITAGIISSVLRPSAELGLGTHKPDMEYIQTDAPITIGNSGGPLVNLDGEVIGINTMTAGPGISFAIPSDFAIEFIARAKKTVRRREVAQKYAIGVSMLSITPNVIHSIMLKTSLLKDVTHGVFLPRVWSNGPAARAGLQRGDVIVSVNGEDVHSSNELYKMVQTGKKLEMEVVRGSNRLSITVRPEPLYNNST